MNVLSIPLIEHDKMPLYLQIYHFLKKEIQTGSLKMNQRLPSTRALSVHLQVSRSTVDSAYAQLLSEGYIESIPNKGYFICEISHMYQPKGEITDGKKEKKQLETYTYDFSPNKIDLNYFPFPTWRKIYKYIFLEEEKELFALGDAKGDERLRETIRQYLYSSRGVHCDAEQIIVGAGNEYLLLVLQKLLERDTKIAVENKTYKRASNNFASSGFTICPIEMDSSGMNVDALKESKAEIAYVAPSHQFPTGVIMPIGRRMELLKWANEEDNRYIVEDDYDSEFRYKGKPIPSLQSSDQKQKVVYLGTFSKAIAPAIRISFMVLPTTLLKKYDEELSYLSSSVSRVDQAILYYFMKDGHFERYLNKMRKIYKAKHDLVLEALKPLRKEFEITGENAGLHLLLTNTNGKTEKQLVQMAAKENCKIYGMSDYELQKVSDENATILLGYASLTSEQIIKGIECLRKAFDL